MKPDNTNKMDTQSHITSGIKSWPEDDSPRLKSVGAIDRTLWSSRIKEIKNSYDD